MRRGLLVTVCLGGCFAPTDIDSTGPDTDATDSDGTAGPDTGNGTEDPTAPTSTPVDSTGCTNECDASVCNGDMLDECVDDGTGCLTIQSVACETGCAEGACVTEPVELAISIVSAAWVNANLEVTYVVANFGAGASGEYRVDLWASRPQGFDGPPAVGDVGDVGIPRESLAPFDAAQFTDVIPGPPSGSHVAYAIIDTDQQIVEADENNNVSIGFAWTDTVGAIHTSFGVPSAPIAIPDDGTSVDSVLTVAGEFVAPQTWVTLNVTHPDISELTLELTAPDGNVRTLATGSPSGANFGGTTFRDGAGTLLVESAAPFIGEFEPATPWPAAPVVAGDWTLRITDAVPGNVGQVNDWSVTVSQPL